MPVAKNTLRDEVFGYVLNQKIPNQILQFVDGTILFYQRFFKKIYDGYAFSISHRFENVATDDSVEIFFQNPENSGRDIYIVVIEIISTGQGWCDVFRDNAITTPGENLTPVNLNMKSTITSVIQAKYGGTYVAGNKVHSTVVPGGSQIRAVGGAVEVGETVIIPENYNLLVRATNKSASAEDMSIRFIWFEEEV